tara:strand:- start:2799 stop:3719 length:921 start_codon:yes stop_codon:yes gene_type:complete
MIVITGAAGFIGWNLYKSLNHLQDILLVDDIKKFTGVFNPSHPVMNPDQFLEKIKNSSYAQTIEIVFHQGACSDTLLRDPSYMMHHNFDYSHALFNLCVNNNIRLIYASSASVYGDNEAIEGSNLAPKNLYANSKKIFDDYVDSFISSSKLDLPQIVGLRYFNVYGPYEHRKGRMASVAYQFKKQIEQNGSINIFKGSENYLRDFIYIDDVVSVNQHFLTNNRISGIFNCGTGIAQPFSKIPQIMKEKYNFETNEIPLPESIKDSYQKYTRADTSKLRNIGKYTSKFLSIEEGMRKYMSHWNREAQ